MFHNLSLRAKILMGSAVTLALLVVLCVVSLTSVSTLVQTSGWVDHTHVVVQEAML